MITQVGGRRSWPLVLKLALAVLIAAFIVTLGMLVYVLLKPTEETANLSISSDDPLAVAEYRRGGESPLIGDHWHAAYAVFIGNVRLPPAPTLEGSGVHTHADGILHMHPIQQFEEGSGAALNKWFEYGGGELTETSMRVPGAPFERTVHNGDPVPGHGRPGEIYVILNAISPASTSTFHCDGLDLVGQWVRVPVNYIPHDGDCIRVMFEPEAVMRAHIKNPPSIPSATQSFSACTEVPIEDGGADVFCDVTPAISGTAPPQP